MICIIWHRVYLYIVSIYIEKERERDRAIHFILDTIYLFRVRFGVYPVHSWGMLRGMTHTEKVIYLACYCLPFLQGTSAAVCTLPSTFFFHLLIEFLFFIFVCGLVFCLCHSPVRFIIIAFIFDVSPPFVVYCLSSLFGELTICCEMQTKLDPSYPSMYLCIPGYPTIAQPSSRFISRTNNRGAKSENSQLSSSHLGSNLSESENPRKGAQLFP